MSKYLGLSEVPACWLEKRQLCSHFPVNLKGIVGLKGLSWNLTLYFNIRSLAGGYLWVLPSWETSHSVKLTLCASGIHRRSAHSEEERCGGCLPAGGCGRKQQWGSAGGSEEAGSLAIFRHPMVTDARPPVSCLMSWEIHIQFVALCVCVYIVADFGVLLNVNTIFHFPDINIFEHIY